MKLIRLILLISIIGISFLAQAIFDQRNLSEFLASKVGLSRLGPARVGSLELAPSGLLSDLVVDIGELIRMSPSELFVFGMFVVLLSSIGFGLVTTRWLPTLMVKPTENNFANPSNSRTNTSLFGIGLFVIVIALAVSMVVTAQVSSFGLDTVMLQSLWLLALGLFLVGSVLVGRGQGWGPKRDGERQDPTAVTRDGTRVTTIQPTASWPTLLILLFGAAILYLWQLWLMPARVDTVVAEIGLQSLQILRGEESRLFYPGATGLPMLAYIPSALAIQLTGEPLFGVRLVGVGTGLLMLVATWLLSGELFRRTPRYGEFGTLVEDDGRWIALLSVVIVAFGHVTFHFSRLPVFLGPVTWGTLGLWALLRGLRSQNALTLALSGMMIGLASLLHGGGLFFLMITPIWWIGVYLLQRRWIYSGRGVGARGLILWLGGIGVVLLPFFGIWGRYPLEFSKFLQNELLMSPDALARGQALFTSRGMDYLFFDNLRLTLFTFNIYPNNGLLFDAAGPFLNGWISPLFFLGVGALILNLDRLPGWLIVVSLSAGVILAAVSLNAPHWLRLLPILPLVAITIAFALDRIRVVLLETAGVWLEQTTVYLALGLIAWAGLHGWLDYYNYAMRQEAGSSHIGRAIQTMSREQTAILLFPQPQDANNPSEDEKGSLLEQNGFDSTVVDFLSSDIDGPKERQEIAIGEWPNRTELPERSRLLIQADRTDWIAELKKRYGENPVIPVRNLRGDPILYIYDIFPEQQALR